MSSSSDKSRPASPLSNLFRLIFGCIIKPLQALGQFLVLKRSILNVPFDAHSSSSLFVGFDGGDDEELDQDGVTHDSLTQVLRNFKDVHFLRIEFPIGKLEINDIVLLKRRADFKLTLDNCIILRAASVINNMHLQVSKFGNDGFCNYNNITGGSNVGISDDN
ncbi:hypothetical protein V6N13_020038 [Hibiscus sabdariffa]